jgi:hypothetical protein
MVSADLGSRRHEVSRLIQRKRQLAYHDENCEREKIEAVIVHCRFTPNLRKAYAETNSLGATDSLIMSQP